MTRVSPAVRRVTAILSFLAEHPGQSFTMTDLVRALHLSRATCHALLAGLVEVGYLYRSSDKTYMLGPALAAIAKAAESGLAPLQVAQAEMRTLADRYDATCSAAFREGTDVIIRERATSVSNLSYTSIPRGTRLPLRPPFAAIYFAWEKPKVTQKWLDDLDPPPSPERLQLMTEVMAFAREHGYTFGIDNPVTAVDGTDWLYSDRADRQPVLQPGTLDPDRDYPLTSLIAPIFDKAGDVSFVLTLIGLTGIRNGREVEAVGRDLREACDRVTAFIGGHQPSL